MRTDIAEIIRTLGAEAAAAAMTPPPAMAETILAVALVVTVLPVALIGVGATFGCGWPPPVMKAGKPFTSGAALLPPWIGCT